MKKYLFLTIALQFFFSTVAAQEATVKEVLALFQKTKAYYETQDAYSMDIAYDLYKTYDSNELVEQHTGVFLSKNGATYSKIMQTEQIYSNHHFIKVNHEEKALFYGKSTSAINAVDIEGIERILNLFERLTIKKTNDGFICTMIAPEMTQLPYVKLVLYLRNDYSVKKQEAHLATVYPYKDEATGEDVFYSPRFEITFSAITTFPKEQASKLKISSYVHITSKVALVKGLEDYELILTNK